MKFSVLVLTICMVLLTSQQSRADYVSDWTVVGQEYQLAGLYQGTLQLSMDAAEARGDHKTFKETRKLFKKFHKDVFKSLERSYMKALKGNAVWIPTRYWNWNPWVSVQTWQTWTPSSNWNPWVATPPTGWNPGTPWNFWVQNPTVQNPTVPNYYIYNYNNYNWNWTPSYGTECTSDPGPCLKCINGFIVPDDGENPRKRCYQCVGGQAVPANGHPCNDYNPCTTNDRCNQGRCKGTKISYTSPNNPICM